jgi:hypothetical protein
LTLTSWSNSKFKRLNKCNGKDKRGYSSFVEISHRKRFRCQEAEITYLNGMKKLRNNSKVSHLPKALQYNEKVTCKDHLNYKINPKNNHYPTETNPFPFSPMNRSIKCVKTAAVPIPTINNNNLEDLSSLHTCSLSNHLTNQSVPFAPLKLSCPKTGIRKALAKIQTSSAAKAIRLVRNLLTSSPTLRYNLNNARTHSPANQTKSWWSMLSPMSVSQVSLTGRNDSVGYKCYRPASTNSSCFCSNNTPERLSKVSTPLTVPKLDSTAFTEISLRRK